MRLMKRKGQVSFEYLLLIAGAMILIVVVILLLKGNVFSPSESDIKNRSGQIQSEIASLRPSPTPTDGGGDNPNPSEGGFFKI